MVQKMTTLIFRSKITHDGLINVLYFFDKIYFCFPENSQKLYNLPTISNMAHISAPSINTRTSLLKSAKASSRFFFLYICMGGIGKLFKPKIRNFHLNLNSQRVFKNHKYFMVSKSSFGAFFQDEFSLCGIAPNHLRFKL